MTSHVRAAAGRAGFDPGAAVRLFRQRWADAVMETAFGPFVAMVEAIEKAFLAVPMARRHPKNKAKVFKIRHPGRLASYQAKVQESGPSVMYLQETLDTVLELASQAHPAYYDEVRDRFVDLMERWTAALPSRLVGRDEQAILEYVDFMRQATEECALDMLDCEERVALAV